MIRHRLALTTRVLYTDGSAQLGGGSRVLLTILKHLDRSIEPHVLLSERGPMEDELAALGVPCGILDLRPGPTWKQAKWLPKLAFELFRRHIDLIHANDPFTYRSASLVARALSIPAICHIHHPVGGLAWALKIAPQTVLTPTQFMRERITESYPSDLIEVIGNPIDTDWFSPGPHTLGEGPHISIAGLVTPHKGHECFLRMAAQILRVRPTAQFHIVGAPKDPSWQAHLTELAAQLGISHAVRWCGWVSDSAARDILRGSDLFVLPSQEEGFCMAVAEAQACGVPVLASHIRPLDEVVMPEGGFLLPPEDHGAFAAKALELLGHKGMAREAICNRFGVRSYMDKIHAAYHRTILTGKTGDDDETLSTIAATARSERPGTAAGL